MPLNFIFDWFLRTFFINHHGWIDTFTTPLRNHIYVISSNTHTGLFTVHSSLKWTIFLGKKKHRPGHFTVLHWTLLTAIPSHEAPPLLGAGLSHVRLLNISPPPHVTLHVDQSDHGPYIPFTANEKPSYQRLL